jgi:methionyl-tRNA synthetase
MAAGLPLPKAVTANGWLLFDNTKMSKSKGNVVRTETILDGFGDEVYGKQFPESGKKERDLFAADVLRYFLLREIPFGQDGSFSFEAMITRYNADLANGYGNLVSRTLGLIQQNFSNGLPMPSEPWLCVDRHVFRGDDVPKQPNEPESGTRFVIERVSGFATFSEEHLWPTSKLQVYLAEIALRVSHVDHYISFHKPWLLAKSNDANDRKKLIEVLYTSAESIRFITALLYPIVPSATAKVWSQLGLGDIEEAAKSGELKDLKWGGLKPGTKLGPLAPIFPRADKGLAQMMSDMESPTTPAPEPAQHDRFDPAAGPRTTTLAEPNPGAQVAGSTALTTERPPSPHHSEAQASGIFAGEAAAASVPADGSPEITIDDFAKVELRVAQIVVAERIPKADKLLRLEVDLGYEKRQILSGIAEWYTPEDLIGRRIVVITNLAPRKMRGHTSHGMLLAASGKGGKPALATFEAADVLPLGARLK